MGKAVEVYYFTKNRIEQLIACSNKDKGILAELRHGVGKKPGERPQTWGIVFQGMPEDWMSYRGNPSREEYAVYLALTLFAVHQQGKDINRECMYVEGQNIGSAVAKVADDQAERDRMYRRFTVLFSQSEIEGLGYYLRNMITILRNKGIGLDYPKLAEDLYRYQFPDTAPMVRLEWGEDYYRIINKEGKNDD